MTSWRLWETNKRQDGSVVRCPAHYLLPAPHFSQRGGVLQLVLDNELRAELMPVTSSAMLEPVSDFLEPSCTAIAITKDL